MPDPVRQHAPRSSDETDLHLFLMADTGYGGSPYPGLNTPDAFRNAHHQRHSAPAQPAAYSSQPARPAARSRAFRGLPDNVPFVVLPAVHFTLAEADLVPPDHPDAGRPASLATDHVMVPFLAPDEAARLRRSQASRPGPPRPTAPAPPRPAIPVPPALWAGGIEPGASRPNSAPVRVPPHAPSPLRTEIRPRPDALQAAPLPELTPEEAAWLRRESQAIARAPGGAEAGTLTQAQQDLLRNAPALGLSPEEFNRLWETYGQP